MKGGTFVDGLWQPDKGLGMAYVLDYIGVIWWIDEDVRDKYRNEYQIKVEEENKRKCLTQKKT